MSDRQPIQPFTRHIGGDPVAIPLAFGDVLRQMRRAAGLSQEALAERATLSWRTISDLERGIKRRPQQETFRLLADALALSPQDRTLLESAVRGLNKSAPRAAFSPPAPLPMRSDLPAPMTPLIGRTREIATVCALVRDNAARLLTITGPGGVGKSRLAIAAATALIPDFPDGVTFVPLAPIRDPVLLLSTIMQTLGIKESAGQAARERLYEHLREKRFLLILDNFEQLTSEAPTVAALLMACPHLVLLITSRASLRIYGEHEYPVAPLPMPEPEMRTDPDALARSAAVELFRQRAVAVRPGFALTAANLVVVGEICLRLDGLPLAIELAVARMKLFTPTELLTRLRDANRGSSLALLTDGARDAPARQRTMRDTIAWSYDLLSTADQALFRRLAVFAGGWTFESAEAICGGDTPQVYDGIAALIDQSLIQTRESASGETRFGMLSTIREYGFEEMTAQGEAERVRRAHAEYFLGLTEQLRPEWTGSAGNAPVARLNDEHDNLRTALSWARAHSPRIGLQLAEAITLFWIHIGDYREGLTWLERFLAETRQDTDDAASLLLRATALNRAGELAAMIGDHARAQAFQEEALNIAQQLADEDRHMEALMSLANIAIRLGEFERATTLLQDSLARARQSGNEHAIAATLNELGVIARRVGDNDDAEIYHQESLALNQRLNNQRGIARTLLFLGIVAYHRNAYVQAESYYEQGLAAFQALGDKPGSADCLANLGLIYWKRQELSHATEIQQENLRIRREIGDKRGIANATSNLGLIADRQGDRAGAHALHTESLTLRREIGDTWGIAMSLNNLGTIAAAQGEPTHAIALCEEGLAIRRGQRDKRGIAESLYHLGLIVQATGDGVSAATLLTESLSLYHAMEATSHTADCLMALAEVAADRDQPARGVRLCTAAALYATLDAPMRPEACDAYARVIARARAALDDAAFAAAVVTGETMSADEAIAEALALG